jgi:DNA-binding NarL/FixJ family response regulator
VLSKVVAGLTNREVAKELGIDPHVVPNYLSVIYDKTSLSNTGKEGADSVRLRMGRGCGVD